MSGNGNHVLYCTAGRCGITTYSFQARQSNFHDTPIYSGPRAELYKGYFLVIDNATRNILKTGKNNSTLCEDYFRVNDRGWHIVRGPVKESIAAKYISGFKKLFKNHIG